MNRMLRLLLTLLETWHSLRRRFRRRIPDAELWDIIAKVKAEAWEAEKRVWGPRGRAGWFADADQKMQDIIKNTERRE